MMIKPHHSYHKALVGIILTTSIISLIYWHPWGEVKGDSSDFTAAEIISIANASRIQNQLSPLRPNDELMKAAEAKANAMIAANSWSHNTPTQTPWQFIDAAGYVYAVAGENLAKDFKTAPDVINAWLNSPSHRENLLNPEFTETGVAVATGDYQQKNHTTLVVQYLAKAMATPSAQTATDYTETSLLEKQGIFPIIYISIGCSATVLLGGTVWFIHNRRVHAKKSKTPQSSAWHH